MQQSKLKEAILHDFHMGEGTLGWVDLKSFVFKKNRWCGIGKKTKI